MNLLDKIFDRFGNWILSMLEREGAQYRLRIRNDIQYLKKLIEPGDVILVEGRRLISRVIMEVTFSRWSHVLLYLGDGIVLDALNDGIGTNTLDFYREFNIRLCKRFDLDKNTRRKIVALASSHLGKSYDQTNIINLLKARFDVKRDYSKDLSGDNQIEEMCSGLIARVYEEVGFPVLEGVHFSQITPGDFDLSPFFRIVKFNYLAGRRGAFRFLRKRFCP